MAYTQSDNTSPRDFMKQAISLMDSGNITESIELLEKAKALDPDNYIYEYEIGYAYYLNKDHQKSLDSFKEVIKYKNANDQCYQMLGNLYDINGMSGKALKTYSKGLELFPNSGRLYLETGNVHLNHKEYNEALNNYEKGIYVDPAYPSNYYRAALLYFDSKEEVWGMIYGEIFMNLEPNTARTSHISRLLYDTYNSQITFKSDKTYTVSFCQNYTINLDTKSLKQNPDALLQSLKTPYGMAIYEKVLMLSIKGQDSINLASLNKIRTNFINIYLEQGYNKTYPVVLFDYHKTIIDHYFFEPYNYWILMKGNEGEFNRWYEKNTTLWVHFIDWFANNPLFIDSENKFHSGMY